MKIYLGHSSAIDYETRLYQPLRDSQLFEDHTLVLPHADDGLFDSKQFFEAECDLVVAEVSTASTGLGIELGWADLYNVPVLAIHRTDADPSSAITAVTTDIQTYTEPEDVPQLIETYIKNHLGK